MSEFKWGVATAAYQIEGAAREDGRGESIWDRFAATPGKTRAGDSGEIACDFYHRYEQDIELMRQLGVKAFRLSIAWPRVIPGGRGKVNPAGLDFYDRLIDALLEAGIEPYPTLYHWDLPQPLQDDGGWLARSTADAFADYAEIVVERLGDRVGNWLTLNEPWVHAWMGHGFGKHAPGLTGTQNAVDAAHHLLLAHGLGVHAVRRAAPDASVGIVTDLADVVAASDSRADADAARLYDGQRNRWFLDPLYRGRYPQDVGYEPPVRDGDMDAIATPTDFLGLNYYFRWTIAAGPDGPRMVDVAGDKRTAIGWHIRPDGLHNVLSRVARDYAPESILITENGGAFNDIRVHDGSVHDVERIDYLADHIDAAERARSEGVPLDGYFAWSLMDNYEWADGYSGRFGLVYVDYPTLERVPKDSFHWYRHRIATSARSPATND